MTRRQRRRRLEMARYHQADQRRRLRAALASAPLTGIKAIEQHMTERGFEQDWKSPGRWRAARPEQPVGPSVRRGPSWAGVLAKRKRKGRRR